MTPLNSHRQVHLVGVVGVIALAAGAYVVGVEPLLLREFTAAQHRGTLAGAEREAMIAETQLRAERHALDSRRERLSKHSRGLESESRANDRMVRFSSLAERHGVMITAIEPGAGLADKGLVRMPFNLAGTAGFMGFTAFLREARAEFPDTRVDAFEITAERAAPEKSRFTLSLTWFAAPSGSLIDRATNAGSGEREDGAAAPTP